MDTQLVTGILSAIGQPTRLEILKLVTPYSHGDNPEGVAAGQLARTLKLAPASLSFHLKDMTYKGLLLAERRGRSIYYRANLDILLKTLDYLVSEVCGG